LLPFENIPHPARPVPAIVIPVSPMKLRREILIFSLILTVFIRTM
jgi:hypothetical protein